MPLTAPPTPTSVPSRLYARPRISYSRQCLTCHWTQVKRFPPEKVVGEVEDLYCGRCDSIQPQAFTVLQGVVAADNEHEVPLTVPDLSVEQALAYQGETWGNALVHRDLYGHTVRQKQIRKEGRLINAWDYWEEDYAPNGVPSPRWKPILPFASEPVPAWRAMHYLQQEFALALTMKEWPDGDRIMTSVLLTPAEGLPEDYDPNTEVCVEADSQPLALTRLILATLAQERETEAAEG